MAALAVAPRRPDGDRVLRRRVLRRAPRVGGHHRLGARARRGARRAASAATGPRRPHQPRRARAVCGMDARLDDLGADQGRRVSGRRTRVRLPRCARRRMCAVARTGRPAARRADARGGHPDRDRLQHLRAPAARDPALPSLGQRRGSARAAAHVLERDGRTRRDRRRARGPDRGRHASTAGRSARSHSPPAHRLASGSTSASPGARCSPAPPASSRSSSRCRSARRSAPRSSPSSRSWCPPPPPRRSAASPG